MNSTITRKSRASGLAGKSSVGAMALALVMAGGAAHAQTFTDTVVSTSSSGAGTGTTTICGTATDANEVVLRAGNQSASICGPGNTVIGAGTITNTNPSGVTTGAVTIGQKNAADGSGTFAGGNGSTAQAAGSVAIGNNASALGVSGIPGVAPLATVALGNNATAAMGGVSIGDGAGAGAGGGSIVIGSTTSVTSALVGAAQNVLIGENASIKASSAATTSSGTVVVGGGATGTGARSTVLGYGASTALDYGTALGSSAIAVS